MPCTPHPIVLPSRFTGVESTRRGVDLFKIPNLAPGQPLGSRPRRLRASLIFSSNLRVLRGDTG